MTDTRPHESEAARPIRRRPSRLGIGRATAILSLPSAVVLAGLAAAGQLGVALAAGGVAVVAALTAGLVYRHLSDLSTLRGHLEDRGDEENPRAAIAGRRAALAPIGDSGAGADLALALERSDRRLESWIARIQQNADLSREVVDSIPDALLLVDSRGRVANANRAARKQFGEQIVDRNISAVIRHPEVLATLRRALAGDASGDVEVAQAAPVERVFTVRIQGLPEREPDEAAALMLFVDLSAIRRAEQMRVDFVANVSHELRTPLATLLGFIETLQGPARDDGDARERFLDIMRTQATRMTRLVNDLLSLSRIETKEHAPPTDRIELEAVLKGVKATLDLEARRKDMRVRVEVAPGLPPVIGDRDELAQVVQNLMDNAIKYGKAGTEVTVAAGLAQRLPPSYPSAGGTAVTIAIRDRGEGIAAEHIPRLTERFYRVDTARSRELGGTGLGLAIVKHIIGHHRGTLTVESEVGKGSTFTVFVPAEEPRTGTPDVTAA